MAKEASEANQRAARDVEVVRAAGDTEQEANEERAASAAMYFSARSWSKVAAAGRRWINLTEPGSPEAEYVRATIAELMK